MPGRRLIGVLAYGCAGLCIVAAGGWWTMKTYSAGSETSSALRDAQTAPQKLRALCNALEQSRQVLATRAGDDADRRAVYLREATRNERLLRRVGCEALGK